MFLSVEFLARLNSLAQKHLVNKLIVKVLVQGGYNIINNNNDSDISYFYALGGIGKL